MAIKVSDGSWAQTVENALSDLSAFDAKREVEDEDRVADQNFLELDRNEEDFNRE